MPNFLFAPNKTFTVPMAIRQHGGYAQTGFFGKWHLGSFYNDSEKLGGITSSPVTHGFDYFNATGELPGAVDDNA